MVEFDKATGVPDLQLFLMRHSIAEPTVSTDFLRNLTPDGIERATRLADHLLAQGLQPSVAVHSPLTRSRQTAQILAERLHGLPLIELEEVIDAGDGLLRVLSAGQWRAPLVVGHNPSISILASQLRLPDSPLRFAPASLAVFQIDALPPTSAELTHWFPLPPEEGGP